MTADIDGLLEQIRQQQEDVARIQRGVEAMEVKGASRGNEVSVTLRGSGRFTEVAIDPEAQRRYNADDLGAMVQEAVNDGLTKLAEAIKARYAPILGAASSTA
jgi:DNA-binding YbaB/EbfC family protein